MAEWALAGGQLLGGLLGANAAQNAAGVQAQATSKGIDETQRQFNIGQSNTAPYRQVGASALYALRDLMGLPNEQQRLQSPTAPTRATYTSQGVQAPGGPSYAYPSGGGGGGSNGQPVFDEAGYNTALAQYNNQLAAFNAQPASAGATSGAGSIASSPDYQFRLQEGYKGLDRGAAAQGSLLSGATQKALQEYGQQSASQEFANRASRLGGIAGIGQNAVNQGVTAGASNASSIADLLGSGAAARGAGTIGASNAWGNAINGAGNTLSQSYYLNKFFPNGISGAGNTLPQAGYMNKFFP